MSVYSVTQLCLTLRTPGPFRPGLSVQETFQARTLELGAISFSRGSSPPRDEPESLASLATGRVFHHCVCVALVLCGHHFSQGRCRLQDIVTGIGSNLLDATACIFPSLPPGGTRAHNNAPSLSKKVLFSSVQLFSHVQLSATPGIAAHQASLSITNSGIYSNSCPARR